MISLFIPGNPVPQGRPKFARQGSFVRTYDPSRSKDWKHFIALRAHSEGVTPYAAGVPLRLHCTFYLDRPKSIKKRPLPVVKPDLDNLVKAVKDGLKGIAWHDDSQVCSMTCQKVYADRPGVMVEIEEIAA